MRVLIGYDGSPSADAALEELKRMGLPVETEILVVTAGEIWMPPRNLEMQQTAMRSRRTSTVLAQFQTQAEQTLQEAKKISSEAAARIKYDFPEWSVETEAMGGEAAAAIIRKAEEWQADLIIVGSQNRSAIGRFFLGSVSQKVVLDAGCSVRVARGKTDPEKNAPRRIVAGIDDTKAADTIIETIAAREWVKGSVLRIITATDVFGDFASRPFKDITKAQDFHETLRQRLAPTGLKILTAVKLGEAREELLGEAAKLHADCIFVGTRDLRGTLDRFLIGSVSSDLAANAPCSVEVVRPRAD